MTGYVYGELFSFFFNDDCDLPNKRWISVKYKVSPINGPQITHSLRKVRQAYLLILSMGGCLCFLHHSWRLLRVFEHNMACKFRVKHLRMLLWWAENRSKTFMFWLCGSFFAFLICFFFFARIVACMQSNFQNGWMYVNSICLPNFKFCINTDEHEQPLATVALGHEFNAKEMISGCLLTLMQLLYANGEQVLCLFTSRVQTVPKQ